MAIGDRIKKLRQRQDQTLEDIAQQVKISRQTLSRYETGVICNIPSDKVELLAAALHCSPAYLMGWDELPPPQHQEEPLGVGKRLKRRRKELGLTAEKLAAKLGVSATTIYRYENGDAERIPDNLLESLAEALSTTPNYLLGEEEEPQEIGRVETTVELTDLDIGQKIKALRTEHGLTLEQVGQHVGVEKSTVRKWETGQIANMRRDKIAALAEALHTTPDYLMGWENLQPGKNKENAVIEIGREDMVTIGNRIREKRIEAGLSVDQLAAKLGKNRATAYRYENGDIENIPVSILSLLAEALRTTPAYLMGWEKDPQSATPENLIPLRLKKVPLLGEIACGEPVFADEHFESYVECDAEIQADFALRCKGDSMINARILDGDIVFIHQQERVENGEVAAVIIDNEATLKRVYMHGAHISLVAENPAYPPIVITPNDNRPVRILGRAILFQSEVR